jgi:hypothetical protein
MSQITNLFTASVIPPGTYIQTITGNSGGPVGPDGAGNINIIGSGNINVAGNAGTFTETITLVGTTNHAVQVGNAAGSLTSIPVGLTGEVLTGVTGADPVFAAPAAASITLTADTGGPLVSSSFTLAGGLNMATSGAGTTITFAASPAQYLTNYRVANASPFVVNATDYYITVDTSTIPITIQLPDAPTIYRRFIIKDSAGNASVQNVTVTTVSGIKFIDGAATFVMNTNYQAIELVYDNFGYQIF